MSGQTIIRLTKNTNSSTDTQPIPDLNANESVDLAYPEECSIIWNATGPGSSIAHIFVRQGKFKAVGTTTGNGDTVLDDFYVVSTSFSSGLARVQIIDQAGFGDILFEQSA